MCVQGKICFSVEEEKIMAKTQCKIPVLFVEGHSGRSKETGFPLCGDLEVQVLELGYLAVHLGRSL
jgi:hypothetical protein